MMLSDTATESEKRMLSPKNLFMIDYTLKVSYPELTYNVNSEIYYICVKILLRLGYHFMRK